MLRVEDTDQKRTVPGAEARLYEDLRWAGLQWDEGPEVGGPHGPYRQSERTSLYQEHTHKLLQGGHAYRCFCTSERLDELARRRTELGLPIDYDRTCAGISKDESDRRAAKGENHVIRLLSPAEYPAYNDLVYGTVGGGKRGVRPGVMFKYGEETYEDPVLLKTNGTPTYHLANVVDDHLMEITHVIRATEWMPSTPKHLALYKAFGWEPPQFAHVGLLVDEKGHKLSKRDMDTDVGVYRQKHGILPSAMVNFVALLGWSHKKRTDDMDMASLIEEFEMRFTKGNTTVTPGKLWYLQRAHAARAITSASPERDSIVKSITTEARERFELHTAPNGTDLEEYVKAIITADSKNLETSERFCERNIYFFEEPQSGPFPDASCAFEIEGKQICISQTRLDDSTQRLLLGCDDWTSTSISQNIKQIVSDLADGLWKEDLADGLWNEPKIAEFDSDTKQVNKAVNAIYHDYLRHYVLGGRRGPSMTMALDILGHDICSKRLNKAG